MKNELLENITYTEKKIEEKKSEIKNFLNCNNAELAHMVGALTKKSSELEALAVKLQTLKLLYKRLNKEA